MSRHRSCPVYVESGRAMRRGLLELSEAMNESFKVFGHKLSDDVPDAKVRTSKFLGTIRKCDGYWMADGRKAPGIFSNPVAAGYTLLGNWLPSSWEECAEKRMARSETAAPQSLASSLQGNRD